jgi:hypothetical protein
MGWVLNATPAVLPPGKRLGTHCIGGWVGPSANLDGRGKSRPNRASIPGPSSPWRVAIPTQLSRPQQKSVNSSRPLWASVDYLTLNYGYIVVFGNHYIPLFNPAR